MLGLQLSEYHTGYRAYSRRFLEAIPFLENSNDFVFDQELIAQVVAAGMARRMAAAASARADLVIACSHYMRDHVAEKSPLLRPLNWVKSACPTAAP